MFAPPQQLLTQAARRLRSHQSAVCGSSSASGDKHGVMCSRQTEWRKPPHSIARRYQFKQTGCARQPFVPLSPHTQSTDTRRRAVDRRCTRARMYCGMHGVNTASVPGQHVRRRGLTLSLLSRPAASPPPLLPPSHHVAARRLTLHPSFTTPTIRLSDSHRHASSQYPHPHERRWRLSVAS